MPKSPKSKKVTSKKKSVVSNQPVWRERKMTDILQHLKTLQHPKPIPGYKSTLPGAPGNWAKDDPGA